MFTRSVVTPLNATCAICLAALRNGTSAVLPHPRVPADWNVPIA
jgi:hypothetical protein